MEPIQTKSKHGGLIIGIIVVLIIVIAVVLLGKGKSSMDDVLVPPGEETVMPNDGTTPTTPGAGIDPEREGLSTTNSGTYANLMAKYKDKMVQFNQECAVVSNKVGFKQGTDILLDNRDTTSVKIVIGSRTFNLPRYGYKVIDLPSVGTFQVDCNSRLNVVTITVQK